MIWDKIEKARGRINNFTNIDRVNPIEELLMIGSRLVCSMQLVGFEEVIR